MCRRKTRVEATGKCSICGTRKKSSTYSSVGGGGGEATATAPTNWFHHGDAAVTRGGEEEKEPHIVTQFLVVFLFSILLVFLICCCCRRRRRVGALERVACLALCQETVPVPDRVASPLAARTSSSPTRDSLALLPADRTEKKKADDKQTDKHPSSSALRTTWKRKKRERAPKPVAKKIPAPCAALSKYGRRSLALGWSYSSNVQGTAIQQQAT